MIVLDRVTLTVTVHKAKRTILSCVDLTIPSNLRIAFLASSREDRRTVINLLSGLILPSAGRVARMVNVSFPVGYLGGFIAELPVRSNVDHLARLYDADARTMVDFIERVAGLGPLFDKPYGQLSIQAKKHLARIVAYTLPFDLYVLTEEGLHGRVTDGDISYQMFRERLGKTGMIIPTQNKKFAHDYCEMGLVLDRGKLLLYDNVEQAFAASQSFLERPSLAIG